MKQFSKEDLQQARKADLYSFLLNFHSERFKVSGVSIHPRDNESLSIKRGYSGYIDFATGETGNSIDYLTRHLGYTLDEAVFALIDANPTSNSSDSHGLALSATRENNTDDNRNPVFPDPIDAPYKQLFAYLMSREISRNTIQMLIDQKILYQEAEHNNIVFANKERDWGELRGTYDFGENPFHGVVMNCRHDGFWWFQTGEKPTAVFICESAIDAISLYELRRQDEKKDSVVYVSIGGVMKQPAIDRLKRQIRVILAVDNDEAGSACRKRNSDLESIIPTHKDWNEDLISIKKGL